MISDKKYIAAARRLYNEEGTIEVDEDSGQLPKGRVSRGEDAGAYVMAWVWVPAHEAKKEVAKKTLVRR
jgi:hypothetical protein